MLYNTELNTLMIVVAGVKVPQKKLRDMMNNAYIKECAQEKVVCYLLDDGGYIILSSEEDEDREVGKGFSKS